MAPANPPCSISLPASLTLERRSYQPRRRPHRRTCHQSSARLDPLSIRHTVRTSDRRAKHRGLACGGTIPVARIDAALPSRPRRSRPAQRTRNAVRQPETSVALAARSCVTNQCCSTSPSLGSRRRRAPRCATSRTLTARHDWITILVTHHHRDDIDTVAARCLLASPDNRATQLR